MTNEEIKTRRLRVVGFMLRLDKNDLFEIESWTQSYLDIKTPSSARFIGTFYRINITNGCTLRVSNYRGPVDLGAGLEDMPEILQELILFNLDLFK
jgi:hypothetical protein